MPSEADPTGNAPSATGMLTPQKPEGDFSAAKLDAYHAQKLLDRAIAKVGSKSDEGKAMLKARAALTAHFGEHEEETAEFSQAELKRMLATLIGPGEAPKPQQPPQTPPPGAQPGMQ
jgi:hypothetical protein